MENRSDTICRIHEEIDRHPEHSMERYEALEELYDFLKHHATVGIVFADVLDDDETWPTKDELKQHVGEVDDYLDYADERGLDANVCTNTWKP